MRQRAYYKSPRHKSAILLTHVFEFKRHSHAIGFKLLLMSSCYQLLKNEVSNGELPVMIFPVRKWAACLQVSTLTHTLLARKGEMTARIELSENQLLEANIRFVKPALPFHA
jgi:hypothetical protein